MRPDGSSALSQDGRRVAGYFFGQSPFATHAFVLARTAIKVPKDVPLYLLGPLCCGVITGAGSVLEAFRLRPGQSIVVQGTGGVGFSALMAARLAVASRIVAVDINSQRLGLALELGATDAVPAGSDTLGALRGICPVGFDFSLITAQAPEPFDTATACLTVQ